jgi:hypothetical protein
VRSLYIYIYLYLTQEYVICEAFHTAKNNQTYGEREYPTIINEDKMNVMGLITFMKLLGACV